MTTVHAELVGDKAVLPRADFERLVELARRSEEIDLQTREADVPTWGIMQLAERGGAFDWPANEDELYSVEDLIDRAEAIEGIRRGLEDVKHGRTRPAAEAFERIRRKHDSPQDR